MLAKAVQLLKDYISEDETSNYVNYIYISSCVFCKNLIIY